MTSSTLDHAAYRATRTFANLDGLRALSVLAVLVFHFDPLPVKALLPIQHAGFFGVDVFFVLSGFLITTLLLREPARPLGTILGGFYARRALRIFPLYYAAVGLYALVAWQRGTQAWSGYRDFVPSLLFYWSDMRLGFAPLPFPEFGHAWSLAVEEKFYLLWPLAVLVWSRRRGAAIAIATIAVVIAWRAVVARGIDETPLLEGRLWYSFDLRVDTIMWGCVLAYALHGEWSHARLSALVGRGLVQAAVVAGIGAVMAMTVLVPGGPVLLQLRYTLMPPLVALLLAAVVTQPAARRWSWLQWGALAFVGRISYGVYVLHPICLSLVHLVLRRLFGEPWQGAAAVMVSLALYMAVTLLVCAASFRWFEAPLLHLRQRFR